MDQLSESKALMEQVAKKLIAKDPEIPGELIARSNVVLAPEESTKLTLEGTKAITKFLMQLKADDYQQALRSTVVSMTFDDKQTVWIPAGSLVGVGYSDEMNDTFYMKADNKTGSLSTYYMMPFQKTAAVTITNYGNQPVTLKRLEATVDKL